MKLDNGLRREIDALPLYPEKDMPTSLGKWYGFLNAITRHLRVEGPEGFLCWDVIRETMFVRDAFAPYIAEELAYLQGRDDWQGRFSEALRESELGEPEPCALLPWSSCNLIHHAYSAAQFESRAGIRISQLDAVFEFGGGYGSMCRLFRNLGFAGRYIIYDFPVLSLLQRLYLSGIGMTLRRPGQDGAGVVCVFSVEDLRQALADVRPGGRNLFLATWSLSEAPVAVRDMVSKLLDPFCHFMLAAQDTFQEVDNVAYFTHFMEQHVDVQWSCWPIAHLPGNRYIMGRPCSPASKN